MLLRSLVFATLLMLGVRAYWRATALEEGPRLPAGQWAESLAKDNSAASLGNALAKVVAKNEATTDVANSGLVAPDDINGTPEALEENRAPPGWPPPGIRVLENRTVDNVPDATRQISVAFFEIDQDHVDEKLYLLNLATRLPAGKDVREFGAGALSSMPSTVEENLDPRKLEALKTAANLVLANAAPEEDLNALRDELLANQAHPQVRQEISRLLNERAPANDPFTEN